MLKRITMRNFMCFADRTVEFDKRISIVSGQNGKGKTTIGTAILWALFNKNYELKDNPVVRKTGVSDKSDVEVELVIDDNTFRKVQKRKRSEKNPTEYSDTNSYYVNDVPVTMKEYNERIGKDQKVLLWGCAINAFLSEKPDVLRAFLFDHIEGISDLEVAISKPEMADLSELLRKYNLEEVRAMNKKVISDSNKDLVILEGQIKEKERDVQLASEIDVAELELKRNALDEKIAEIEGKLEDVAKLAEERQKESDGIMELKFKLSDMERNANAEVENKRREINNTIWNCHKEIDNLNREKIDYSYKPAVEKKIEVLLNDIKDLQEKWKAEKARVFDDSSLVCPYCGQEYQEEKKEALKLEFEVHKAELLDQITTDGNAKNEELKAQRERLTKMEEKSIEIDAKIKVFEEQMAIAENELTELVPVDVKSTPEYIALADEVAEKEKALGDDYDTQSKRAILKQQLASIKQDRDAITAEILKSSTEQHEERLEELLEQSRTVEQKKANAEKILNQVDILEKEKNGVLSEKVNALFSVVNFQLFEYAKNGTYKNCCIPTIDGKSLLDNNANKALRIIGKLDICNSIQTMDNVDFPIILDDGEALDSDNLIKVADVANRQVIVLRVSDDPELKIL